MWSGLGYYSRGRRLHKGAIKVGNQNIIAKPHNHLIADIFVQCAVSIAF